MSCVEICINQCGEILVWDANCIQFLREECRIFGKFVGTVARAPHKTTFKGIPLKLGVEELVTLMMEKSDRIFIHMTKSLLSERVGKATPEMVHKYQQDLENNYAQISKIFKEEKIRKTNLHFEKSSQTEDRKRTWESISGNCQMSEMSKSQVLVHLPTGTPQEWLRSGEKERIDVPQLDTVADSFTFLATLMRNDQGFSSSLSSIVKCVVYNTLWNQGHCVTLSCKKMGGDYLLYSGDPWAYHASHVVKIIPSSSEMRPSEWISSMRLVNGLKKKFMIAWYNEGVCPGNMKNEEKDIVAIIDSLNITFNELSWSGRIP